MTKKTPSNKLMIIICTVVIGVVAAVAAFIALRTSGEESYRSIMVYELEGSAVIERADIGTIDAAENLYLESGDRVQVKEDSMMRLKLDNDKYITAEENTVFVLTAKGNEQDSETKINLEQGAITNEIQNPLSENSTYETITPNSVMAVRGTIYRAELCQDEDGNLITKLYCFKGAVGMSAISEGDVGVPVIVEAGNEASVSSADLTVSEVTPIDYKSLTSQTLEILNRLGIDTSAAAGREDHAASPVEKQDDVSGQSKTDNTDNTENTDLADRKDASATQKSGADAVSVSESRSKESEPVHNKTGVSQPNPGSGSEDNGSADSGTVDNKSEEKPDKEPSKPDKPNKPGKPDNPDEPNEPDNPDEPDKPDEPNDPEPPKAEEYTVTFLYNGQTFATQKVKAGDKAKEPVLKPAQDGIWDFDFETKIDKDTLISWK